MFENMGTSSGNIFERITAWIAIFFMGLWQLLVLLVTWVTNGIGWLINAVFKDVRGRTVKYIGAIVFLAMIGYFLK